MAISFHLVGRGDFKRALDKLEREVFPTANYRALNRAASRMRTETVRSLAKFMGLKQKDIRERMTLRKASRQKQNAILRYRGRPFNLIRFKARQLKSGVKAKPWGKWRTWKHAFIANVNGVEFVAIRRRRGPGRVGRLPMDSLHGPGIARTANEDHIAAVREDVMRTVYPAELEKHLTHLAGKLATRRASR